MSSSKEINSWNEQWRANPLYTQILSSVGVDPSKGVKLSKSQQKQVQAAVEAKMGFKFPKGVEIDAAGNMNEDEGFGKQLKKWGPIVGAGALAAFGIPGLMPGLLTGGGAAAGAGTAATSAANTGSGLLATSTPAWATQAALSGTIAPAAGMGAGLTAAELGVSSVAPGMVGSMAGKGFSGVAANLAKKALTSKGLDLISGGLSKSAAGMAANRGAKADIGMQQARLNQAQESNYFDTLAKGEQLKAQAAGDAWKRLLQTSYLTSPASQRIQTPGFSTYSKPIAGPTASQVAVAGDPAMQAALRARANFTYDPFGGQTPNRMIDFSKVDDATKMGGWEKALGIGSTAAKIGSIFF